jgi:ribosomal protein S18 acetylase RimI-like enzyme
MTEITFEQFEASELAEWLARSSAEYIEERVAAGDTRQEATANAEESLERTFPSSRPALGQLAGRIRSDGQPIGELWVGRFGTDPSRWWVWDIRIDEQSRGRGFGRRAMLLAEEMARANGAESIGLNVFAHNRVARNLYGSLGYQETSIQMRKDLVPSARERDAPSEDVNHGTDDDRSAAPSIHHDQT